jgi:hypothetical protein
MSDFYRYNDQSDVPTTSIPVPGTSAPGAPLGTGPGRRRWSRGKQAGVVLAICAVVGGGTFAAVQASTSSPGTTQLATQAANAQTGTQAGTQTGTQAGSLASATSQAGVLKDVLTNTGIRRLARLRLLGGLYGQFTYQTKQGPRTLAFERGTIASVGGGEVVVRAADGTSETWTLTGTSVVRENGTKESATELAQGQTVFAGGPVTGGTRDARLIVIRKATAPKPSEAS